MEIPTDIDSIIDELSSAILSFNKKNEIARWHFFIGSPGNGKSEAMGKLCKILIQNGCKVLDDNNTPIEELEATKIPYAINVREGNNIYASAQIVQDASVVPNPFSHAVDPAIELLNTLSNAWKKGISLIICTNRGVLEKAHRDNLMNHEINTTPWFKILKAVVEADYAISKILPSTPQFDAKKSVFKKVSYGYSHLDNHSLLQGHDTFDQLIQKATSHSGWENCVSCSSRSLCPFEANREALSNEKIRQNVLHLLTKTEILSGQVIVFREALAIISLLLAGCPRDYDRKSPCEWVHSKIENRDFFALATRRIYMSLFTPYSPYGLEANEGLREKQKEALKKILNTLEDCNTEIRAVISHVINNASPCTDVGVSRCLGENGAIVLLDPCNDSLPYSFYNRWDLYLDFPDGKDNPCISALERKCLSIWKNLDENLESIVDYSVPDAHVAVKRWSSNFLLHLGALYEGKTAWAKELDEFVCLTELMSKPQPTLTIENKKQIIALNSKIETLLNSSTVRTSVNSVNLSEKVTLRGKWVQDHLKPKIVGSAELGNVSLAITFRDSNDRVSEQAVFAALMYLWLSRRATGHLDHRCFPQELLTGVEDARIRAASKGEYAIQDNDVELIIEVNNNEKTILTRLDGEVDVSHE